VKASTAGSQAAPPPSGSELEQRVYSSVKKRLGDQVDETLLKAIVQRVLKNVGGN
jgi:citrate lyase gamma subunit